MKKLFILTIVIGLIQLIQEAAAQLDTRHFIPPIYYGLAEGGGSSSNFDRHYLLISTPSVDPIKILVTDGSGTEIINTVVSNSSPITHLLGKLQNGTYVSDHERASGNVIGTTKLNQPINDGLIIEAEAPVYANIRHQSGYQGASLTAKGCAALGREFRVATMRNNDVVHDYRSLFFSAMAMEDDTIVEIDQIKKGIVFTNTQTSGSVATSEKITVTLQRGESYVVGIKVDQYAAQGGTAPLNDVNGTRVTSSKPIVMNSGTVLGCPDRNNIGSRDMGFDQIAPVTRAGREYIFVKGSAINGSDLESPTLVVVEDNTNIFVNGSLTPFNNQPLDAGDYLFLSGQYTENSTLYVESDKPILAWQTMAGANSPATPGLNFVPPLNEDIATSVNNIAEVDLIGEATVNIVARANETVTIDGASPSEGPFLITGTEDWVFYSQKALTGNPRIESSGAIAVSLVMLKNPIGAGAYYSGYPDFKPLIQTESSTITKLPGVVLSSIDPSGGIFSSYEWFYADGTSTGITGERYEPTEAGSYYVVATSEMAFCPPTASAPFLVERYAEADLELIKSTSVEVVESGSIITFTLEAINHGPDIAEDITVRDILPDGYTYIVNSIQGGDLRSDDSPSSYGLVWSIKTLATEIESNAETLTFQAYVHAAGTHTNRATISSEIIDAIPENNTGVATPVVTTPAPTDPSNEHTDEEHETDICDCEDTYVEFNIRDLDTLATYGVFLSSYDAARDVWHLVRDVLHCREQGTPLEEEKRGFIEEDFFITEDSEVIVTVIYDGADYYNSLAFYDAADPNSTWKTIWESFATGPTAPLIPGSSASLGVIPSGTELRFGLVMNGGKGGTEKIYQDAYLNPGGLDFMASNILLDMEDRPLIVAFEDQLFEGRDNDFNDVILKIDIIPTALGVAQHDGIIANKNGLNSDRGYRGVTALLENFGINEASYESTAELFSIPAGLTELTFNLLDDRSSMKFSLAAFDYDLIANMNPATEEFHALAAQNAVLLMDDRNMDVNDQITINPKTLGIAGKTIGLLLIPNNTVSTYLTNPWRYSPKGNGDRTKRQPLFSLINANPQALDQYLVFSDTRSTFLAIEDHSRINDLNELGDVSDDSFDDIQIQISPALEAFGFHDGRYFEGSADPTEGFQGEDGYGNDSHGSY